MESGLLKMFHDGEHFESVYQMPFDEHNDIWNTERDTLHMNLSHTLDGILPASPNHQPATDFDCDLENKNYMNGSHYSVIQQNQIKLEFESDDDEFENRKISITSIESEDLLKCIAPAVEIIPIDPDCEYSSPLSNDRNDDDSSCSDESDDERDSDKKSSSSSCSSSSSQDEDDEDDMEDENVNDDKTAINLNLSNNDEICDMRIDFSELASFDKFMSPVKNSLLIKTPEKLGNDSSKDEGFLDDDKLDSDIDVKNFDLTKYITEDDCKLPPPTPGRSIKIDKYAPFIKHKTQMPPRRGYKRLTREFIESDSDESIDVETVSERSFSNKHQNTEISDIPTQNNSKNISNIDDNINADPTWTPTKTNTNPTSSTNKGRSITNSKFRNKVRASIPTQPNNISQNRTRMLSAGAQLSRNKLLTFVSKANEPLASSNDHDYCSPTKKSKITNVQQRRTIEISPINPNQERKKQRVGVGLGKGKSLLLTNMIGHSKLSGDEKDSNDDSSTNSPLKQQIILVEQQIKTENTNPIEIKQEIIKETEIVEIPIKEKRKLNLQEYKKRRENSTQHQSNTLESIVKKEKIEPISKNYAVDVKVNQIDVKNIDKPNSIVNENSKSIARQTNKNLIINNKRNSDSIFDPILEATRKALRLKKSKISEPKIKIPAANPLIPLLPLAELTAMSDDKFKATMESDQTEKFETNLNINYEEIVIVSIGCNTNITLPPNFDMNITNKILNSSSLLSNINDTINKVKCSGENIRISSNSLLSSITNEVLKKTSDSSETNGKPVSTHAQSSPNIGVSPSNYSPGKPETTKTKLNDQHGEIEKLMLISSAVEHGEDKIIMHLRKDRIKPKNYSTAIQTDSLPHFMPLQKLETIKRRLSENHYYNHNGTSSRNRNSSYSSNDDDFNKYSRQNIRRPNNRSPSPTVTHRRHNSSSRYNYNDRRNYRENNRSYSPNYRRRTRSPHLINSRSRSRDHHHNTNKNQRPHSRCSTNSISSNSSSRSRYRRRKKSRRHSSSSSCSSYSSRSRSRGSSIVRRSRSRSIIKDRQTSPEERRIVYVGRIEKETTKEDIKAKFLTYGPIKQITFHHKDTGMKYGFVTYERAQDAFKAIDSGGRDPEISMYDISFGGRRAFCRNFYSDLDGANAIISGNNGIPTTNISTSNHLTKSTVQNADDSFEALLQKVKEKMGAKNPTTKT